MWREKNRQKIPATFLILHLALFFSNPAFAAPADDVKALSDQGKSLEAYILGKTFPEEFGNPAFDFYFGVSALDSGHAAEGVLALERYVLNFPDSTNAHLELARGYFLLGEDGRAREEFDAVLKTNPPLAVQANIQRFMDAIRARESRYQTTASFFLEAGLGYDSNVNGGVNDAQVNLPIFGLTTLTSGVKTADSFTHLALGGQFTYPVAPGIALFGAASLDGKMHPQDDVFNQQNLSTTGGFTYLQEKNLYRASLSYSTTDVDNNPFRDIYGIGGEWNHQLDELQAVNFAARYSRLAHTGDNRLRNADYTALSLGYRKAFISDWKPLLLTTLTLAQEENRNALGAKRDDLSRDIIGLRVGASVTPAPKWSLSAGLNYQQSDYQAPDILLITRKDAYRSIDAAVSYAYTKNLQLRSELLLAENGSNNPLNKHRRDTLAFKVRYEF